VKGSPHNDWLGCFAEWSDAIAAHIGKKRDLVVAAFSTTGPIERAASEIVLMSAMKNYFQFHAAHPVWHPVDHAARRRGRLQAIRRRAEVFVEFGLDDWGRALLPVLDQFVRAAAESRPGVLAVDLQVQRRTRLQRSLCDRLDQCPVSLPRQRRPLMGCTSRLTRNDHAFTWSRSVNERVEGPTIGCFPGGCLASRSPGTTLEPSSR